MTSIYLPSTGASDWQRLLVDPMKHWRDGYSAKALAERWEGSRGLPPEIARLFEELGSTPELLLAIPEHKVPLPGSNRGESQNDLFALIRAGDQTFATTIEGKVNEPFGGLLGDWLKNASPGKLERLAFICDALGLREPPPNELHYQLLHRTASAVIEARRFKTDAACMIVHSFFATGKWQDAFAKFVRLFGSEFEPGCLIRVGLGDRPPLYLAWATGP